MKKILGIFSIIFIFTAVVADNTSNLKVMTVKKQAITNTLSYSGIIEPLTTQVVTASEEGTIDELNFQYGQPVQAGQLLFEIKSKKFQDNFISAIKTYLTAKQQFHQSQTKLKEQDELWKYGLISRDTYTAAEADYYNNELALLQGQEALLAILENHKSIQIDYENLNLKNIDQLKKVLYSNFESTVKVHSPRKGIALIPDKSANQGLADTGTSNAAGPVVQGSAIQQNQAVLAVGDLSGVTINIDVNEIYINEIKPGLKAIITSVAFPDITLYGEVTSVGSQAASNSTSEIPTFPVVVKVPQITKEQRAMIRVGMSAKVQLVIAESPKLLVPIDAVTQQNGKSYVSVQTDTGVKQQLVTTGETTVSSVVILSGLKEGDKIVLPN